MHKKNPLQVKEEREKLTVLIITCILIGIIAFIVAYA